MFSYVCDSSCRNFLSTPAFLLSRMHRAQIPTDDAVWHLTGSPQRTPIAAAKHLPECGGMAVMSVTSHWRQSHTLTRTACPDFSKGWSPDGLNLPSFYIIRVFFNALQNLFHRSLKIICKAYILVWCYAYHKIHIFETSFIYRQHGAIYTTGVSLKMHKSSLSVWTCQWNRTE